VYKIFGPGNRYVTLAKQLVSRDAASIDMPAGPSEVMVMADSSADPVFIAADLLSQAEHGRDSQAILLCNDRSIAVRTLEEIDRQAYLLPRGEYIRSSLEHSRAIVLDSVQEMLDFAEMYAPEHLIISMTDAEVLAERITSAGSVFIGHFSPESAGDYASGTNHTLPTSGWAHSCSGVNVDSFIRKMTLQKLSPGGLQRLSGTIVEMAGAEGLEAHAQAVRLRLEKTGDETVAPDSPMSSDEVVRTARGNVLALSPYSTARDEYEGEIGVFLDANENPFPTGFNRYPDPHQKALKARISKIKGIPVERLFLGNGSDEAIDLILRVFCRPGIDNVVSISPSYGMYKVAAATNDVALREVSLKEDFSLDTAALLDACDACTKVIFLCSPNNPSGNTLNRADILSLARSFHGIVVVDEAYVDFSTEGSLLPEALPNMVFLQTLSKAWGLAGLRIGLCIADPGVIRLMSKVKYPYNISKAAMEIALERLQTPVRKEVDIILSERRRLEQELPLIPRVKKVWPSQANFLLVQFSGADAVYHRLVFEGVIVRNRSRVNLCQDCLRITVGTPEENDKLLSILKSL